MKMTKKLLAILLSVCLIGSLFVGMASAANSNVGFTVSATTVEVGDTVEVEIYNNAANLQGMGLWLSFDTSLLSLQSVTGVDGSDVFGAYAGSMLYPAQVAEVNGGLFSFGVFGAANGSDFSAGTIATLTFVATGEGVATFELSEDSAGEDGYTGGVNAASVTIKEAQGDDPIVDPEEPKDSPYFVYDPSGCNGGPNCPSHKFTDVDHTQWYHEGIDFVVANKIMAGVSDTLFGTHDTTTRGMIVTILYRMAGEPALKGKNVFTDVANDTWYTKAVIWAKENNIVAGVSADEFAPNAAITREQMATMLYNFAKYMGYDVSAGENTNILSYADGTTVSGYAYPAMQWACAEGLISGMPINGDLHLVPQGNAERCQVASIIMRFCKTFMK